MTYRCVNHLFSYCNRPENIIIDRAHLPPPHQEETYIVGIECPMDWRTCLYRLNYPPGESFFNYQDALESKSSPP
jgi:hypothetical protein